jgi:hypothetical protein
MTAAVSVTGCRRRQLQTKDLVPSPLTGSLDPDECCGRRAGLVIPLVIQTIRRDRSRSVWTDEAPNASRPGPSGADQTDAEHQATDLVSVACLALLTVG